MVAQVPIVAQLLGTFAAPTQGAKGRLTGKKRSRWQKLIGKVYSLAKLLTDMFKILSKCYARIRPSYGCEAIGVGLSWVPGRSLRGGPPRPGPVRHKGVIQSFLQPQDKERSRWSPLLTWAGWLLNCCRSNGKATPSSNWKDHFASLWRGPRLCALL